MNNCPYCGTPNTNGIIFCEECGQPLGARSSKSGTRQVDPTDTNSRLGMKVGWGTARLSDTAVIYLHIRDATDPLMVAPSKKTVIGRKDAGSINVPDLDLTPYGALEKGVSRIHAAICRADDTLTLMDLGSSNGTYLNGQQLAPEQPRVLRDGDKIRFGKLVANIYFK